MQVWRRPDRALIILDNALHAGESDALTGHAAMIISPAEDIKYLLCIFGGNPNAGVAHPERGFLALDLRPNDDAARRAIAHVLDRVVDQILKHLPHPRSFHDEHGQLALNNQVDAELAEIVLEQSAQVPYQVLGVDRLQLVAARLDAAEFQNFTNQLGLDLNVVFDAIETTNDFLAQLLAILALENRHHPVDVA